jgi:hypothetical protein
VAVDEASGEERGLGSATPEPLSHQVVYVERVRQRLLALADVAQERGSVGK